MVRKLGSFSLESGLANEYCTEVDFIFIKKYKKRRPEMKNMMLPFWYALDKATGQRYITGILK